MRTRWHSQPVAATIERRNNDNDEIGFDTVVSWIAERASSCASPGRF